MLSPAGMPAKIIWIFANVVPGGQTMAPNGAPKRSCLREQTQGKIVRAMGQTLGPTKNIGISLKKN